MRPTTYVVENLPTQQKKTDFDGWILDEDFDWSDELEVLIAIQPQAGEPTEKEAIVAPQVFARAGRSTSTGIISS